MRAVVSTIIAVLSLVAKIDASLAHQPVTPWKIMALGDSITGGCYPAKLWQKLSAAQLGTFEFVGTQKAQACGVPGFVGRTEAHAAYHVENIFNPIGQNGLSVNGAYNDSRDLRYWFANSDFDILLMHIGSTAAYGGKPRVPLILQAYRAILKAARARNPRAIALVAQLIPLATPKADVRPINNAIPGWAAAATTEQSPVIVVDMFTGFDPDTMTGDKIHPNMSGSEWMAQRWFEALRPVVKRATADR